MQTDVPAPSLSAPTGGVHRVRPHIVLIALLCIAAFFTAGTLGGALLVEKYDSPLLGRMLSLVHTDQEDSLATWFATAQLCSLSLLMGWVAFRVKHAGQPYAVHWAALACVALYMSFDESVGVHELLSPLISNASATGLFYAGWVIPGIGIVLVFSILVLPFTIALAPRTRTLLCTAAAVFVVGAIGFEMIGAGRHRYLYGSDGLLYDLYTSSEEALELAGVSLAIYALLQHLRRELPPIALSMTSIRPRRLPFVVTGIVFAQSAVLALACWRLGESHRDFWAAEMYYSIPVWYTTSLWVCVGAGAGFIAYIERSSGGRARPWIMFAALSVAFSLEARTFLHERILKHAPGGRVFTWGLWIILLAACAVVFRGLFTRLHPRARALAAAAFVAQLGGTVAAIKLEWAWPGTTRALYLAAPALAVSALLSHIHHTALSDPST